MQPGLPGKATLLLESAFDSYTHAPSTPTKLTLTLPVASEKNTAILGKQIKKDDHPPWLEVLLHWWWSNQKAKHVVICP